MCNIKLFNITLQMNSTEPQTKPQEFEMQQEQFQPANPPKTKEQIQEQRQVSQGLFYPLPPSRISPAPLALPPSLPSDQPLLPIPPAYDPRPNLPAPIPAPVPSYPSQMRVPFEPRPIALSKVKLSSFIITLLVGQLSLIVTWLSARSTSSISQGTGTNSYTQSSSSTYVTICLAFMIVHGGCGLVYLLINIAIQCQGPQTFDLSCSWVFLFSRENSGKECIIGFFIAWIIEIIWIIALLSYICGLSNRRIARREAAYQPNGSQVRLPDNRL